MKGDLLILRDRIIDRLAFRTWYPESPTLPRPWAFIVPIELLSCFPDNTQLLVWESKTSFMNTLLANCMNMNTSF